MKVLNVFFNFFVFFESYHLKYKGGSIGRASRLHPGEASAERKGHWHFLGNNNCRLGKKTNIRRGRVYYAMHCFKRMGGGAQQSRQEDYEIWTALHELRRFGGKIGYDAEVVNNLINMRKRVTSKTAQLTS